jgi:LemA protein
MGWMLAVVAVLVVGVVVLYNRLVGARNRTEEAWAQVDVQLRRRHDLIPNLVETVRAYATHEREVFEAVTRARSEAISPHGPAEQAAIEEQLTGAVRSLFAVAEGYPELRASENFLELQRELASTEDRIAYSRQFYNASVQRYDTLRETFPTNLLAGAFGFTAREYYEADPAARAVPPASFGGTGAGG